MAYKKDDIIRALEISLGCPAVAAGRLGCTPKTIRNWIDRSPDVRDVYDKHREMLKDEAKVSLRQLVRANDRWAVGYALNMDDEYRKDERLKLDHSGSVASPSTFAEWIKIETERSKK